MKRALALLLLPFAAASVSGCGGGGITSQDRPVVVAFFPADGTVLTGWLHAVRVTFDERVRILDEKAVAVEVNGDSIEATVVPDPEDERSVFVVAEGGRWVPGARHRVVVHEGAVVNDDDHYLEDEREMHVTLGARPNLFVSTDVGDVTELEPYSTTVVGTTAPPAGFAATTLLGADDEVFAWLEKTGAGDDVLGWLASGDATLSTVPLAAGVGERVALGLALSVDGKTLYATAIDRGAQRVRVHRVDTATRTEVGAPLVLSTDVTAAVGLARRPAVDPLRNRLYVAMDDGAGGGTLSVVDLATFTEVDVRPGAGASKVLADGAGDLTFGLETDRVWMTIADEPYAGLVVIDPVGFGTHEAREQEFTAGPVCSVLTPDERFFLQGLAGYTDREGLVRSTTDEIGDGFARTVNDDVGGTLVGSSTVSALLVDPASTTVLAFAVGTGTTVMVAYEWLDDAVTQLDLDFGTDGVQGIDLGTAAPGEVVSATFLRGATAP